MTEATYYSEEQSKNAAHKINMNFDMKRFCPVTKDLCRQDCMSWVKSIPIFRGLHCSKEVWGGASTAFCSNSIVDGSNIPEVNL